VAPAETFPILALDNSKGNCLLQRPPVIQAINFGDVAQRRYQQLCICAVLVAHKTAKKRLTKSHSMLHPF